MMRLQEERGISAQKLLTWTHFPGRGGMGLANVEKHRIGAQSMLLNSTGHSLSL